MPSWQSFRKALPHLWDCSITSAAAPPCTVNIPLNLCPPPDIQFITGWSYFGAPQASYFKKLFWLLVILASFSVSLWLIHFQAEVYLLSYTKINIEDRSADLKDTYFPSVVICNVNPLRKSFIYWLQENLEINGWTNVSIKETFDLIGSQYFSPKTEETSEETKKLKEYILQAEFFQNYFLEFMNESIKTKDLNITSEMNKIFLYDFLEDEEELLETLGQYTEATKKTYHENFLYQLASQWKIGQMIPHIRWDGMDPEDRNGTGGVYLELGFGTNYGVCSFISPFYRMPPEGLETSLQYLPKGALNGENNGLSLLLGNY